MTKRSGSNTRRRAISRPVRLTEALGKKVHPLTDDRGLKEVMRLGALQKKLFIDGKRVSGTGSMRRC